MPVILFNEEVISDIQFLTSLTPEFLQEFTKIVLENLRRGSLNKKKCAKAADSLHVDSDMVFSGIRGLTKAFFEAAKHRLSSRDLTQSLSQHLSFPEASQQLLAYVYDENYDLFRSVLEEESLKLPHYYDLEWRLEAQVATRAIRKEITPMVTLRLETREPTPTQQILQCDYSNLSHMRSELATALNQLKTPHSSRIQKYIK